MFNSTEICAGQTGLRNESWWAAQGGPGFFKKYLDELTSDPLEVPSDSLTHCVPVSIRLAPLVAIVAFALSPLRCVIWAALLVQIRIMTGADTYYENLGILSLELDACICKSGMDARTCAELCDGVHTLECKPGEVVQYDFDSVQPACIACEVGKYETMGVCQFADDYSYVEKKGSFNATKCPANTRVCAVDIEVDVEGNEEIVLRPRKGARSEIECVVRCHAFAVAQALSVCWWCSPLRFLASLSVIEGSRCHPS
jgi:hypothetical protein